MLNVRVRACVGEHVTLLCTAKWRARECSRRACARIYKPAQWRTQHAPEPEIVVRPLFCFPCVVHFTVAASRLFCSGVDVEQLLCFFGARVYCANHMHS